MIDKVEHLRPTDPCLPFQMDLSCMVDDELGEAAVRRVLVHLETCSSCRLFWDSLRGQVVVHRQLADPESLKKVLHVLEDTNLFPAADPKTQIRRLAAIYYQLGKAYILAALNQKFRYRLLDEPVPVKDYQIRGRHFVERVILKGKKGNRIFKDYDWVKGRHLLQGRLDDSAENLEKGRVLLEEAIVARPRFSEPRIYLADFHRAQGDFAKAQELLEWVFQYARRTGVRGNAAIHLGGLHAEQSQFRRGIGYTRWVLAHCQEEDEFLLFAAHYNTAIYYAQMENYERSAEYFRKLLQRNPNNGLEAAKLLQNSEIMNGLIASKKPFSRALKKVSPVLVASGN